MGLSAGNYICYFTEQGLKKTSKGQQFIRFGFEVVAYLHPQDGRKDRQEGKPAVYGELVFWLTDKAFDNTLRDASKLLGGELTSFTQLDPRSPKGLSALNKEHELTLRYEEYQGKQQARWSLPREMGKPLTEPEIEALDERLKSKASAKSEGTEELPGDFPAPAFTAGDEDLPF